MDEKTVFITNEKWYESYVEILKMATINAIEKGVPEDIAWDNFESAVRSAAFDAVKIEK